MLRNYTINLNSFVASHPCAAPFGQLTADQKHSRCFCLKNLASNDVHGCTEWQERQDAGSGLEQNRSSLMFAKFSRNPIPSCNIRVNHDCEPGQLPKPGLPAFCYSPIDKPPHHHFPG